MVDKNDKKCKKKPEQNKKFNLNYDRTEFLKHCNEMKLSKFNENIIAICNHFEIDKDNLHIYEDGLLGLAVNRNYILRPEVAELLRIMFINYAENPFYDKRTEKNKKLKLDLEESEIIKNVISANDIVNYNKKVISDINSLPKFLAEQISKDNGYEFNYMLGKYLPLIIDHFTLLFTVIAKSSHVSAGNIFEEIIISMQTWIDNYQKHKCLSDFLGETADEKLVFNVNESSILNHFEERQYTIDDVLSKAIQPFLTELLELGENEKDIKKKFEVEGIDGARKAFWELQLSSQSSKKQLQGFLEQQIDWIDQNNDITEMFKIEGVNSVREALQELRSLDFCDSNRNIEQYDFRAKIMQNFLDANSVFKNEEWHKAKIKRNLYNESMVTLYTGFNRNYEYDGINYIFFTQDIPICNSKINSIKIDLLDEKCSETTKFLFEIIIRYYLEVVINVEWQNINFDENSIKEFLFDIENIEYIIDCTMQKHPVFLCEYFKKFDVDKKSDIKQLHDDINNKQFDYIEFYNYLMKVKKKFDENANDILIITQKAHKSKCDLFDEINSKDSIESKPARNMRYLLDKALGQMLLMLLKTNLKNDDS